jgi:transcriptional regulator with XRE-family HTH domain
MTSEGEVTGRDIRRRRLSLGLNQEQLAVRAGVSKATLAKIEAGQSDRAYRLRDVERALGEIEDLFTRADPTDAELIREFARWFPALFQRTRPDTRELSDAEAVELAKRLSSDPPRHPNGTNETGRTA